MFLVSSKSYRFNTVSNKIPNDIFTGDKKETNSKILKYGTSEKKPSLRTNPGAVCVGHLLECLPSMHKALGSKPSTAQTMYRGEWHKSVIPAPGKWRRGKFKFVVHRKASLRVVRDTRDSILLLKGQ